MAGPDLLGSWTKSESRFLWSFWKFNRHIIKNYRTYFQNPDLHFDNLAYNINKGGDFQNADGRFD